MNNPIIVTAETATQLNSEVQKLIGKRLILFCNYEPAEKLIIGQGQLFDTTCNHLYLFAKDSCCILSKLHYFDSLLHVVDPCAKGLKNQIEKSLETIELLRHFNSHNQSPQNGHIQQARIQQYKQLIGTVLHKDSIDSEDDYKQLNEYLYKFTSQFLQDIRAYLNCISQSTVKQEIADKWIHLMLDWYSNNTKQEIYWGILTTAYLADMPHHMTLPKYKLDIYISKWIKQMLFDSVKGIAQSSAQNTLDELESGKLTSDIVGSIEVCRLIVSRIQALDKLKQEYGSEYNVPFEKCKTLFFSQLPNQLSATIAFWEQQGDTKANYTLLPQHLFSEDIDLNFGRTASV